MLNVKVDLVGNFGTLCSFCNLRAEDGNEGDNQECKGGASKHDER